MNVVARLTLIVALTLIAARSAAAADPVSAAVTLDRSTITVGDRIAMSVIVDAEPGFAVSDPTLARQVGAFEVIQTQAVQRSSRGSVVRYTYRYVITAWSVGDLVLPPIDVAYLGPNGLIGAARTAEVPVRVVSVVNAGEDISDIKPLKPQLALGESPWAAVGRVLAGLAIAALVTALVALALWSFLRRRVATSSDERLTPAQRALRELAALAEERLPEQGRTAEHYARLTASLRRYAVDRYGVLPGRTSRELRDALEQAGLERGQTAAIFEILREGDEVRFRHATPYPAHAHNAVRAALEIVRRAASAEEYEIAALQPQ
ncbi:MAG TPA: BatD family protein [Candidatus Limnocylindria bacterium]|nr:BatD family protein [Candidatus Limnocylindria bacterium]